MAERRADFARFTLSDDETTRAAFPHPFALDYGVQLLARGLRVELAARNTGDAPLPLSPGWHPYFRCPSARKPAVTTDVPGLDPRAFTPDATFDFGLPAPADGRARFAIPDLGTLRLSFSPAMRHLQFWSQPGRDFVCLEPFHGPSNTIQSERALVVPPGESRELWMRVELDAR